MWAGTVQHALRYGPQSLSADQLCVAFVRHQVVHTAVRVSIPPGGVKPRVATGAAADGGRRRNSAIEPHEWAGQIVWAKLERYPWWPAQVRRAVAGTCCPAA